MEDLTHLLYRGESESLDFKRDQYRFVGASDGEKSELLKDILAMANAWRTEPAYILIGVDEGPPPNVVGITEHLDDASIQQFVNKKTNRPILFNYSTISLAGQTIGVFKVPVQKRPFFVKSQFGKVSPNAVYLRRGSSTDVASPDEIAAMGETPKSLLPELILEFADFENRTALGQVLNLNCLTMTVEGDLPDFGQSRFDIRVGYMANTDFFRDVAAYLYNDYLCRSIAVTLTNKGSVLARDVRVEIELDDPDSNWELHDDNFAETHKFPSHNSMDRMTFSKSKADPISEVKKVDSRWLIAFDVGSLQPQRTLWPAVRIFGGCHASGTYELQCRIFAENLPSPIEIAIQIVVNAAQGIAQAEEIVEKAYPERG